MLKSLFNPLDKLLRVARKKNETRFIICWNRGLGDIPLGLYALVYRIRQKIPDARVVFLTRTDLAPLFSMVEGAHAIAVPSWKRGEAFSLEDSLREVGISRDEFDQIIESPDPSRWLKWQIGSLIPRLMWDPSWDSLVKDYDAHSCVGMHIDTETGQYYGYEKNWPAESWNELIADVAKRKTVLLFGMHADDREWPENVIDLRGKTSLFAMLSLIKNRCSHLVAPDSGILSVVYYVAVNDPLRLVSLWADPHQGVLRQDVPSPNPNLIHLPLIGKNEMVSNVDVKEVLSALAID